MKAIALAICLFAGSVSAQIKIGLSWTPSPSVFTGPTNVMMIPDGYVIVGTTNVAQAVATWAFVTNVPSSFTTNTSPNFVPVTNCTIVSTQTNFQFFAIALTNGQGQSPFSGPAGVQPAPSPPTFTRVSIP